MVNFLKSTFGKIAAAWLMVTAVAILAEAQTKKPVSGIFTNPLVRSQDSADPWMFYHDGFYYLTATFDPEGGVWLRRSKTLAGFEAGEKKRFTTRRKRVCEASKSGRRKFII